ncbi:hypothetical protein [Plasticicumulans sp.]|uniref:hypothetical protein n=1 Tax=Plasticicumulans sp. TaxID=2307179 RepID=UPI00394C8E94
MLGDLAHWLTDFLLWLPRELFAFFLSQLAEFLAGLPVPEWLTYIASVIVPPGLIWWLGLLQIGLAVKLCGGAWMLRFLLRRVPIVG